MNIIKRLSAILAAAVIATAALTACSGGADINFDRPLGTETFVATADQPLRRAVSPEQPMWIVHIDSWVNADPEKLIDAIPEDIRPFVVFNISMSISWNEDEQRFTLVKNGYERYNFIKSFRY